MVRSRLAFLSLVSLFALSAAGALPVITLPHANVEEEGTGALTRRLFLHLEGSTTVPVSARWTITPQTGFVNEGTVVFQPGENSKMIEFRWMGDGFPGPDRTYWLNFSDVQNATASPVAINLADWDRARLSVEDVIVLESAGQAVITVTLSAPGRPVTFHYRTSNGTAKDWSDYGAVSGSRTIPAHQSSTNIVIPIFKDWDDGEGPETFDLGINIYDFSAEIARGNAMVTILEEDVPAPRVTMDDWSGRETEGHATFILRMPTTTYKDVTVVATTSGITASQGSDYVGKSQLLTIPAGTTTAELVVDLADDALSEEVETFRVDLGNPTNAVVGPESFATGAIHDDDSATSTPSVFVDPATVLEGHSGTTIMPVRVWLDRFSDDPAQVEYETENLSALAGSDYVRTTGTLTFAVGETEKFISVPVNGDTFVESNETLLMKIAAVSGALGQATAACVITNDDSVSVPAVSVLDASIVEGHSGTKSLSVRIELSASSSVPIQITYATAGGTAQSGADFHSTSGTVTLSPGSTSRTITVPIIGDVQFERDETFFVNITVGTGATVSDGSATCTITNDDAAPFSRRRRTRH